MRRLLLAAACVLLTARAGVLADAAHRAAAGPRRAGSDLATTYVGRIVFAGLCDKLFDIDEKLNIVPQLATGYEWADDRTLVIHLRPGVKFQNGEVLDAAAVKYSLERHLTMQGSFRKSEISSIDHVEVVDPATVRDRAEKPVGRIPGAAHRPLGHDLAAQGDRGGRQGFRQRIPVCSGPFKFVERVPQDHVTLERFADYWDAKDIHFDKVVYQVLVDSSVRLANLKAGTVDLAEYIAPTDAAAVKADPKLRLVVSDALGYFGITNNLGNGPRAEQSVWPERAGAPGVRPGDRPRGAGQGGVQRHVCADACRPCRRARRSIDEALKVPPRDVAKAKALLQAGRRARCR